ncbi:hypothetical protein G3N58_17590 [Paraburkholderia sp. Ac-20342]|uniref:hypothetical protein n=1 Tax=Paraburkholderia sp. Ac-20342 TaxID=2703889 RepID=UPI00197CCEDC|nr:hypothetical protein [Paraburkholderia sp. Ac-20342]MBN3848621.1 hypothetical protein [Paraburkholderia sp. Ac-20342]
MSDNVLREFLVSLGFSVDAVSLKKFENSVESVTKSVMKIGAEVTAAAIGVVAGVKIISSQMENLYYASQRTGATVGNIMALRYAAGQIGLTADQAQGALEGFARTLRLNPGSGSLLDSLGVAGGDPSERFTSFIEKMKGQQPYVAAAYAQLFGIDPDTLLMLENGLPKLEDEKKKYASKLAAFGIDPDQAAEAGKDFNNSIRAVRDTFNDVWIVIESKLAPVLTPLVNEFERFAENHAGEVAQGIADAVQSLADWIQSVNWKKVGDDIVSVYHALGGLKGILIGLAAIQLLPLVTGILNLASAVTQLGAVAAGGAIGGLLKVLGPIALMFHSEDLNTGEDDYLRQRQAAAGAIDPSTFDFNGPANRGGKVPDASPASEAPAGSSPLNAPRGIRNNNPGNIRFGKFAQQMGATVGDDKGFAVFQSMEDGIKAAIELLKGYVSKGYDTVRKIISRWAPAGENNTAAYIDAVAKKLGISADAQLSGDQLGGVAQAIFQHENGRAYGNVRSLMDQSQSARLGGAAASPSNVSIQQHNEFRIDGAADPQATARAIGSEQTRVNGDFVRNFYGAVR